MSTAVLDPTTSTPPTSGRVWGFIAILTATILNILDATIVNVAGPSIRTDLSMSTSALEWIAAAYTLALAVGLMTGARLGDMCGRRRLFLIGLAGFVLTSALCALTWNVEVLISARALQGLSAALVLPQCFGLIRDLFSPEQVGKAFGAMGPVIGLATVLGPVTAGVLIKLDLFGTDWRSLFLINVPFGVAALLLGRRFLPAGLPTRAGLRLDLGGLALLTLASVMLIFPLVDGRTLGWPVWVFVTLAASVPVFALFVLHQRSRMSRGLHPLVETSILRQRSYVSGIGFILVFFCAIIGFSLAMALFLQIGLGLSPMRASLYLAAMAIGTFLGAGVGSWLPRQ